MKINYPIGGFAPGFYSNKCCSCGDDFTGDKLARQCEPCAVNSINESNKNALSELYELKIALDKIKSGNDMIMKYLSNFSINK